MEVAIKEAHAKDAKEEMLEEAKAMIKVSKHDHIVNFQGICVHNDAVYLLLELCTKGPIDSFLQVQAKSIQSKLVNNDYEILIQWCAQVADGMGFLVKKNIIHVSTFNSKFVWPEFVFACMCECVCRCVYNYAKLLLRSHIFVKN